MTCLTVQLIVYFISLLGPDSLRMSLRHESHKMNT